MSVPAGEEIGPKTTPMETPATAEGPKTTLAAIGLNLTRGVTRNGNAVWTLSGSTEGYKNIFRKLGARQQSSLGIWSFYGDNDPTERILKNLPSMEKKEEVSLAAQEKPVSKELEVVDKTGEAAVKMEKEGKPLYIQTKTEATKTAKEKEDTDYMPSPKKNRKPEPERPVQVAPDLPPADDEAPSRVSPKAALEIENILGKAIETVIRAGSLGRRGAKAEGYYKKDEKAGKVRRKNLESWRVTGHELGHAFHRELGFNPHQGEMRQFVEQFYPGGKVQDGKWTSEGFAEFMMRWFADNEDARRMAPKTAEKLDNFLIKNPALEAAFTQAKAIVEEDLAGTELERMRQLTARRGLMYGPSVGAEYSVGSWWRRLLFNFVDYTMPLRDLYEAAVKKGYQGLPLHKLASVSGQAREQAIDMFRHHARDKAGRFLIPDAKRSLEEIANEVAKIPNGVVLFNDIFKSMRYKERSERGFDVPESVDFDKVVEHAKENYPRIVELVEEYSILLSEINLRMLVRAEVISEETADRVRAGSKYYFPMYTVNKLALDGETSQRRSSGKGVKRYREHKGQTLDIFEATIMRLHDTLLAVEVNRLLLNMEEAIRQDKMGTFGVIEERPQVLRRIGEGNLKWQIEDIFLEDMDPDDEGRVIRLFMPGGIMDLSKNEPVLMARHGDGQVFMRVAPDIFKAVLSMKPLGMDLAVKALAYLANMGRVGALFNLRYITNAVMRDIVGSSIQTQTLDKGKAKDYAKRYAVAPIGFVKGAIKAAGGDPELMSLYIQSGAYGSSVQETLDSMLRSVRTDGLLATPTPGWKRTVTGALVRVVRSPLEALRVMEEAPRIPEFEAILKRELEAAGLTMEDLRGGNIPDNAVDAVEATLVEAAYASREVVVNFGLHGVHEGVRKYARTIPFMQGGIQGIYRECRQVKDKPGETLLRWCLYILPITLIAWGLSHRHDKYKDMPSESRDSYWWFPVDKEGNFFIALAKPYFYGMLPAGLLERFLDWTLTQDQDRRKPYEDLETIIRKTFGFPVTSMVMDTILGLMTNENHFGTPIVPEREQGLSPELQYGPGNTQAAIMAARALAILMGDEGPSPRQIDYFVKGIFGGVGGAAMEAISWAIPGEGPGSGREGAEYLPVVGSLVYGPGEGGSRITDKFYEDYTKAQKLYADVKEWEKRGIMPTRKLEKKDIALIRAIPAMRAISGDLTDMRGELRTIVASPKYTPSQKRIATLRYNWLQKVAAGYLYGRPVPAAPTELGLTEADVQNILDHYDFICQKAVLNALKRPGGPL